MVASPLLGAFFALAAAGLIGGGDFSGGAAARKIHPFQVAALAALASILQMGVLMVITGESLPSLHDTLFAGGAGIFGALGVITIYRALTLGNAALAAPIAGVTGALLPVLFSSLTKGLPSTPQMIGIILALPGIALAARPAKDADGITREGFLLAVASGVGAGGFLILLAQVETTDVFAPSLISKSGTLLATLVLLGSRRMGVPSPLRSPLALLSGVLDGFGNVFYLLAQQFTRLDIAAVITSLYPAATVLLSCLFFKEKVSHTQWAGIALCLLAIGLIAT